MLGAEETAIRAGMVLHATLGRVHARDDEAYSLNFGKLCRAVLLRAKNVEARNAWTVAAILRALVEEDDMGASLQKRAMSVLLMLARTGDQQAKAEALSGISTMLQHGYCGGLAHQGMRLALVALQDGSVKLQLAALDAVVEIGCLTQKRTALVSTGAMGRLVERLQEGPPAVQHKVVDAIAPFLYVETCRLQFSAKYGFKALVDLALTVKESEIEEEWAQMLIYELSVYPLHRDLKDLLQGQLPSAVKHLWRLAWLAGHLQLVCDVLKIWRRAFQVCPEHAGPLSQDARQAISDMLVTPGQKVE